MLQKTVKGGCALRFRENLEPCKEAQLKPSCGHRGLTLLDGTEFFLEIDI
jgi:hypothetical protein